MLARLSKQPPALAGLVGRPFAPPPRPGLAAPGRGRPGDVARPTDQLRGSCCSNRSVRLAHQLMQNTEAGMLIFCFGVWVWGEVRGDAEAVLQPWVKSARCDGHFFLHF